MPRPGHKHYKEWLSELPEPYRTEAFENLNPHLEGKQRKDDTHTKSMANAISIGLRQWQATPQGWYYWRELYNRYCCKQDRMDGIFELDSMEGMGAITAKSFPGYMPKVYSMRGR